VTAAITAFPNRRKESQVADYWSIFSPGSVHGDAPTRFDNLT